MPNSTGRDFPSMRGAAFLALLRREPLKYHVERQKGSHRTMVSPNGYPELRFAFHDSQEIPKGLIRVILTQRIGLSEEEALELF
ncbi:MAG: type II toxin-antitoxin system HicA family toxin [Acidobacteria bacterium]|nr:type II toxin-antitoxin system HicA family toxin [Acidobacteriota bacterium]